MNDKSNGLLVILIFFTLLIEKGLNIKVNAVDIVMYCAILCLGCHLLFKDDKKGD